MANELIAVNCQIAINAEAFALWPLKQSCSAYLDFKHTIVASYCKNYARVTQHRFKLHILLRDNLCLEKVARQVSQKFWSHPVSHGMSKKSAIGKLFAFPQIQTCLDSWHPSPSLPKLIVHIKILKRRWTGIRRLCLCTFPGISRSQKWASIVYGISTRNDASSSSPFFTIIFRGFGTPQWSVRIAPVWFDLSTKKLLPLQKIEPFRVSRTL